MPETHIASGKVRDIYEIDDDRLHTLVRKEEPVHA